MSFDRNRPYNDLPLLPPSADLETREVLKVCIKANRSLAELKGLAETIPNPGMLISSLTLQEARSSSEIENIVTTNDAVFRAFTATTQSLDPATKEVLRYREAIWDAYQGLQETSLLTTNLFIRIVQTIKQNLAGIRTTPGTQLTNDRTGKVIYTPPQGADIIREKLKNLETYIHTDDGIDPLIRLAVIHFQFEAIHPFSDGNGRTGRIINILYLIQQGLLDLPILYLSKYINEKKGDYYRLLNQLTVSQTWEPWIIYMLDAIDVASRYTSEKILSIREQLNSTMEKGRLELPSHVYSKELFEILFRQPYVKSKFLVDAGIAKRQTAAAYLKELEKIGILRSEQVGRETLYLNLPLSSLLES